MLGMCRVALHAPCAAIFASWSPTSSSWLHAPAFLCAALPARSAGRAAPSFDAPKRPWPWPRLNWSRRWIRSPHCSHECWCARRKRLANRNAFHAHARLQITLGVASVLWQRCGWLRRTSSASLPLIMMQSVLADKKAAERGVRELKGHLGSVQNGACELRWACVP